MKTFDDYMKLNYRIEIVKDEAEDVFIASHPELKGCLTVGKTIDEAVMSLADAKAAWLQSALEDGYAIPLPVTDDAYSGQFKLRIPRSLHRELAEEAKREGISMNQYCLHLLSRKYAVR